jgi:hypothetical protein
MIYRRWVDGSVGGSVGGSAGESFGRLSDISPEKIDSYSSISVQVVK